MASPAKKAFPLRIPPELWDALARLAASEMRSVNAQIEYLLREGMKRRGVVIGQAPDPDAPDTGLAPDTGAD